MLATAPTYQVPAPSVIGTDEKVLFFLMIPRPPRSSLFPCTTLFRSEIVVSEEMTAAAVDVAALPAPLFLTTYEPEIVPPVETDDGLIETLVTMKSGKAVTVSDV